MRTTKDLVERFRQKGFRVTPQRRLLFDLLCRDDSHPTAEQIYERASAIMPDISLATVYDTLHRLVELGEIQPVEDLSDGGLRYDTNVENHHHLFCLRCNRLVDITLDAVISDPPPDQTQGFRILKRQITFQGICPECQRSESDNQVR